MENYIYDSQLCKIVLLYKICLVELKTSIIFWYNESQRINLDVYSGAYSAYGVSSESPKIIIIL